jgi:7-keto-8-aminopelargonate synthetase-like enzyme
MDGIRSIGYVMSGGTAAIVSVQIGEIEKTLKAGKWMFDRGYFVQSATYPAVPILGGLLRMQVNAIHSEEDIDGLLNALADLKKAFRVRG